MWSRFRIEAIAFAALAGALAACGGVPIASDAGTLAPPVEPRVESSGVASAPRVPVEVPPRAAADFARAVSLMQAGHTSEAELEFQQLAAGYPQLAGPHVNLGILYRKAGRLDPAVAALRTAVERNPASVIAWNELGVALRMRGDFQEAAAAYERAIGADPGFAPAYRNLGVLRDLYLGDAHGALAALEQYKSLSGEDRPVAGWIAELRQRTGTAAPLPAPAAHAQESAPQSGGGAGS